MAMIYIRDDVAERLKATATRDKRQISSLIEVLLDFGDADFFYRKNRGSLKQDQRTKGGEDGQKILEA